MTISRICRVTGMGDLWCGSCNGAVHWKYVRLRRVLDCRRPHIQPRWASSEIKAYSIECRKLPHNAEGVVSAVCDGITRCGRVILCRKGSIGGLRAVLQTKPTMQVPEGNFDKKIVYSYDRGIQLYHILHKTRAFLWTYIEMESVTSPSNFHSKFFIFLPCNGFHHVWTLLSGVNLLIKQWYVKFWESHY